MNRMIRQGDCREVMLDMLLDGEQFDACICDPPYDLTSTVERFGKPGAAPAKDATFARMSRGFMGRTWDGTGVAFDPATWRAVYDVLKPGAHLLAFGGSRTYHRMACAIEDAGFELRDCIMWIYGTGFPKSLDVSKAIDKAAGAVRTEHAPGQYADRRPRPTADTNIEGAEYGFGAGHTVTAPATAEAAQWQGWGTALKPAFEPIIVARKPLGERTVAANVLANGTGAINIDACRVPLADDDKLQDGLSGRPQRRLDTSHIDAKWGFECHDRAPGLGRHPANVLHDGSDEVEAAFAAFGQRGAAAPASGPSLRGESRSVARGKFNGLPPGQSPSFHGDSGTASRFFYSAKAGKADRADSKHPTVKPLALMRWLCTLVTPPGGRLLDPFAGSGTTLQAALECGFVPTGIEAEAEYIADIENRLLAYLVA